MLVGGANGLCSTNLTAPCASPYILFSTPLYLIVVSLLPTFNIYSANSHSTVVLMNILHWENIFVPRINLGCPGPFNVLIPE